MEVLTCLWVVGVAYYAHHWWFFLMSLDSSYQDIFLWYLCCFHWSFGVPQKSFFLLFCLFSFLIVISWRPFYTLRGLLKTLATHKLHVSFMFTLSLYKRTRFISYKYIRNPSNFKFTFSSFLTFIYIHIFRVYLFKIPFYSSLCKVIDLNIQEFSHSYHTYFQNLSL